MLASAHRHCCRQQCEHWGEGSRRADYEASPLTLKRVWLKPFFGSDSTEKRSVLFGHVEFTDRVLGRNPALLVYYVSIRHLDLDDIIAASFQVLNVWYQ